MAIDPFTAKLLACRDATRLALEKSFSHVIIESDCQNLCNMWMRGDDMPIGGHVFSEMWSYLQNLCNMWIRGDDMSIVGHVFREMWSYLSSFQVFKLDYTRRDTNVVAYSCAGHSLSLAVFLIQTFLIYS